MSNYKFNISGCFRLKDYKGAAQWFSKAAENLNTTDYEALVVNLLEEHPNIFDAPELSSFRANIKTASELKNSIESALESGNFNHASNLFNNHFSYKEYPEYFDLLEKCKKLNPVKEFQSKLKKDLDKNEKELERDILTFLKDLEKPFFRRVQTEKGNFYITKDIHYDLSIIKEDQVGFARHLPWYHPYSEKVLNTEIGQHGAYGKVSLIGDYKPHENDLKDVSYLTLSGRSYFASAIQTLTNQKASTSKKIDIENFMKMKEVIPTPSQMKAISAKGNYIIDGPAGTGKSTTLLQKLLVLKTQKKISTSEILVLVKHDGLIKPFEDLLSSMKIHGVNIYSTSQFLKSKLADDYAQISLKDLDESEVLYKELNSSLNHILAKPKPSEEDIETLPASIVNKSLISSDFKSYCKIVHNKANLEIETRAKESELINNIEKNYKITERLEEYKSSINTLEGRLGYSKSFKNLDEPDQLEISKLRKEYRNIRKLYDTADAESRPHYEKIIANIYKKFEKLETSIKGINNFDKRVTLKELADSKIDEQVKNKKDELEQELLNKTLKELEEDIDFQTLKKQLKSINQDLESKINQIRGLVWGGALTARCDRLRKIIQLYNDTKLSNNNFHTVIIDEAQDVPNTHIELINFYAQNLIIVGDEAQRENPDGIGQWKNLRKKLNIHSDGQPTTYKLRHNFRQTYELGNLSYNYRQLLLGNPIEDLESDYFDNQKGFNIPAITSINNLSLVIKNKLKYIEDTFEQNFPILLVVESSDEQVKAAKKLEREGFSISTTEENNDIDVIIKTTQDIAGREYPVLISMLSNDMSENTVYIILSRAKFDLTLVTQDDYEPDSYFDTLMMSKMISYNS